MASSNPGADWSREEIDLLLSDYVDMLQLELAGRPFNKAERNRHLQKLTGRSRGSIEFKHQNVSAVMDELGLPWVQGYKPARNYQNALIEAVEDRIAPWFAKLGGVIDRAGAAEAPPIFLDETPPSPEPVQRPQRLERLVRKFDPAVRDARNRALGEAGEAQVLEFERRRLTSAGRSDLAKSIVWTSKEVGDGAGYDIESFDTDGRSRLIEVKTTNGGPRTPFYLTENERAFAAESASVYRLVRLYDFARRPRAFELSGRLEDHVSLAPTVYRARLA